MEAEERGTERGSGGGGGDEDEKKGQSRNGEPDCPQRDLIMNHNERAGAHKRAMGPRISRRWGGDGVSLSYVQGARARVRTYVRFITQRENVRPQTLGE